MQLRPEQLAAHLKSGALRPVYGVSGDEPLQSQELLDALRAHARGQGFAEREVAQAVTGFDWMAWLGASLTAGLFSQRRIIELRSSSGKFGVEGGKAIERYCRASPPDTLLLLSLPKLDAASKKTAWYKAVDQVGAILQVWPLEAKHLPQWLARRLQSRGVRLNPEALQLLVSRVEGNLLAAAQAVERLALWSDGKTTLNAALVAEHIADSAHFSIYDLADAALAGEAVRALRILQHLQAEGEAPVLILWALTRDLRVLAQAAFIVQVGERSDSALARLGVMERRWGLLSAALQRQPLAVWQALLAQCAHADRVNKGVVRGDAWLTLAELCQQIALPGRGG
jgi:DNA polymerase-3 subunit delta